MSLTEHPFTKLTQVSTELSNTVQICLYLPHNDHLRESDAEGVSANLLCCIWAKLYIRQIG